MPDEPNATEAEQTAEDRRRVPRRRGATRTATSSTSPGKIRRKALSRLVFDLRVQGHPIRAIAEQLIRRGYKTSATDVQRILQEEFESLGATREKKEQARELSLVRIETWMAALAKRAAKGDDKAIATSTKLDERIAKYLGTEAPQEHGVKLTVLGQVNWILDIITEELGADATERVLRRISAESSPPAPQGDGGGPPGEHEPIPGRDA